MNIFTTSGNAWDFTQRVLQDLLAQKEAILMGQLSSLVRDGVLMIEETEPVLVQETDPLDPISLPKVTLRQAVRLTFRGEEVLNEYREKVRVLEEKLEAIRKATS